MTIPRAMASLALVGLGASGCLGGGRASIAPVGMAPGSHTVIDGWVQRLSATERRVYWIRPWQLVNERGSARGQAAIRVSPPDSIRIDYSGPFGRSGRAAAVGDRTLWVVPPEDLSSLIQLSPLLWAAIGLPQVPPANGQLWTVEQAGLRGWRYIVRGDSVYVELRGTPVTVVRAEVRRGGKTIGFAEANLDPQSGLMLRSRIEFPQEVARFDLQVERVETNATFSPTVWRPDSG